LSVEGNLRFALAFLTSLCDWLESLAPLFNQSVVKPKPIVTCRLLVFASSFYWSIVLFVSVEIGWSDYFGFGCLTLIAKLLYTHLVQSRCSDKKSSWELVSSRGAAGR